MSQDKDEIMELIKLLSLTRDEEINCDQCLSLVAEFAEKKLGGKSLTDALKAVEQHLLVCSECREEFEILKLSLEEL